MVSSSRFRLLVWSGCREVWDGSVVSGSEVVIPSDVFTARDWICYDSDSWDDFWAEGRYRLLKIVGNKLRRFDVCWGLQSRCNRDCPGQGRGISMKIDYDCLLLANSAFVFVVYSALCSCFVYGF
ncbi:hypothetical protein L6452_14716 [Arctium lappa]|uniref:Uncharacterized protein n=1 Tax=Arctium lappa TaxID=4217 RepID=A0ACB9CLW2_ARCLA|nr:hypothetical protein L6452_14716 [Arctium lappa]